MGVELEGRELSGFEVVSYIAQKVVSFQVKTSEARNQVGKALGNRIKTLATGVESNSSNSSVGGMTISQVQDVSAIGSGLETISTEAVNTTKEVIRDGADAAEVTGDFMVFVAPATGPVAPVVAGFGASLSAVGSATNITMDVIEGDFKSATERVAIEATSAGLSTKVFQKLEKPFVRLLIHI